MSIDEEIRRAEREDPAKAERLRARLLAPDEGYRWTTLDGRTLRLHEIADDHLTEIIRRQVRRALKEYQQQNLWTASVFWWRVSRGARTGVYLGVTNQVEGRWSSTLLAEGRRRGLPIMCGELGKPVLRGEGAHWWNYLGAVLRGQCDQCAKARKTVKPHGPSDVLLCATCARGWEWRCSRCGTPCANCRAAKRHEIPACLRWPQGANGNDGHARCGRACGARMAWLPRALPGSREGATGVVSSPREE